MIRTEKRFHTVKEIEIFFEQRRIKNEQSNLNYYKSLSRKYLDKINPKTGILFQYEKRIERYKKANLAKIEKDKRSAIRQFQEAIKLGIPLCRVGNNNKTKPIGKSEAKSEFQLFSKISRADKDGIVKEITTGKKVHWRDTQGGHFISASVNATCFEIDNVRPQFQGSNRIMSMGDEKAEKEKKKYEQNLIVEIGIYGVEKLEKLREDERQNPTKYKFGKSYFLEIYEKYKTINDEIFLKNPTWHRDKTKDKSYQTYINQ